MQELSDNSTSSDSRSAAQKRRERILKGRDERLGKVMPGFKSQNENSIQDKDFGSIKAEDLLQDTNMNLSSENIPTEGHISDILQSFSNLKESIKDDEQPQYSQQEDGQLKQGTFDPLRSQSTKSGNTSDIQRRGALGMYNRSQKQKQENNIFKHRQSYKEFKQGYTEPKNIYSTTISSFLDAFAVSTSSFVLQIFYIMFSLLLVIGQYYYSYEVNQKQLIWYCLMVQLSFQIVLTSAIQQFKSLRIHLKSLNSYIYPQSNFLEQFLRNIIGERRYSYITQAQNLFIGLGVLVTSYYFIVAVIICWIEINIYFSSQVVPRI